MQGRANARHFWRRKQHFSGAPKLYYPLESESIGANGSHAFAGRDVACGSRNAFWKAAWTAEGFSCRISKTGATLLVVSSVHSGASAPIHRLAGCRSRRQHPPIQRLLAMDACGWSAATTPSRCCPFCSSPQAAINQESMQRRLLAGSGFLFVTTQPCLPAGRWGPRECTL